MYEAFVHPAMFSNANPKRVAIIGGGRNIIKEVLKHKSIEKIEMFPTDADADADTDATTGAGKSVHQTKTWSDCSDFVGREKKCDDDEVVEINAEPFTEDYSLVSTGEGSFDVIFINM